MRSPTLPCERNFPDILPKPPSYLDFYYQGAEPSSHLIPVMELYRVRSPPDPPFFQNFLLPQLLLIQLILTLARK